MPSPNDPTAPAPGTDPANDTTQDPTNPPEGKEPDFKGDFDEEKAKQLIANLRTENGAEKAKRKAIEKAAQDQIDAIAKAAGLKNDDAPEEIAKKLAQEQQRSRDAVIELATYKACAKPEAGVNALDLLDSRSFMSKVAQLDPTSASFDAEVAKAVSAAVAEKPSLKTGSGKGAKSGADFSSGTPKQGGQEPKSPHERLLRAFG